MILILNLKKNILFLAIFQGLPLKTIERALEIFLHYLVKKKPIGQSHSNVLLRTQNFKQWNVGS